MPRDAENKKEGCSTGWRSGTASACGTAGRSNPHAQMLFRFRREEDGYGIKRLNHALKVEICMH